jgi:O-antigen ligase
LIVYLSFESGGFFPGATAAASLAVSMLLLGRVLLADDPFEGVGPPLAVAAGALMLFAAWTLASGAWSDSSSRAMIEFDRVLLYLLTLVFFGSFARHSSFMRWMLRGLALGMTAVCAAAFITRTLPDVWSAPAHLEIGRLSYPIGYWNALGLMASLALVFCLHLTSSSREPGAIRLLAAAACPLLGATLLLTFSRGPLGVAAVGVLLYAVLGRPRLLLTGLLASGPATAVAVLVAYRADVFAYYVKGRGYRFSDSALGQAHDVALAVGLCMLGALLVRALGMAALDDPLRRLRLRRRTRRGIAIAVATLALAGVAVGTVAATRGDWIGTQYDRLVHDPVTQTGNYRDRLFNPGLSRLDRWDVALDGFSAEPLIGNGAGTWRLLWERNRPNDSDSNDAHSLYLEVLSELGLVGGVLLAIFVLIMLGALAFGLRGRARAVCAGLLVAGLMWAVHAGIDWDWEVPAVTLWLFAAGGAALAAPPGGRPATPLRLRTRLLLAAGVLLFAVTPFRIALSQGPLSASVRDHESGRCAAAIDSANKSISALGNRPEPYEVLGYCEAQTGRGDRGVDAMKDAIDRDPKNWEYHYGLAVVRAAAGLDPRTEARTAFRLNPLEPRTREALRRLRGHRSATWRRAAKAIGLKSP